MTLDGFCGAPVEAGAEFVHGRKAATLKEVREAGLKLRGSPQMRRTAFNLGGATRWLPVTCLHPGTWACAGMRGKIARSKRPDLSAQEFIEIHGYRGRARQLTEMTFLQHLPGSADDVGVLGFVEDGVLDLQTRYNHRIVSGYSALPRSLANGLDIRLNSVVQKVRWEDRKVRVELSKGSNLEARTAVLTVPIGVLKSGSIRFDPVLPSSKKKALAHMESGPITKILLHFRENFWPRWMEMLACATGPVNLYWSVFRNVREKPSVLTGYCIGPRAAALALEDEDKAVAIVMADLQRLFPGSAPERSPNLSRSLWRRRI